MKKNITCLQYCISGMSDRMFSFAKTTEGKKLIDTCKMMAPNRDEQIKEVLIAYNSYFMVQGAITALRLAKTQDSVVKFMMNEHFNQLHNEVVKTVQENYTLLMSCLKSKDKRKLEALFA